MSTKDPINKDSSKLKQHLIHSVTDKKENNMIDLLDYDRRKTTRKCKGSKSRPDKKKKLFIRNSKRNLE